MLRERLLALRIHYQCIEWNVITIHFFFIDLIDNDHELKLISNNQSVNQQLHLSV